MLVMTLFDYNTAVVVCGFVVIAVLCCSGDVHIVVEDLFIMFFSRLW